MSLITNPLYSLSRKCNEIPFLIIAAPKMQPFRTSSESWAPSTVNEEQSPSIVTLQPIRSRRTISSSSPFVLMQIVSLRLLSTVANFSISISFLSACWILCAVSILGSAAALRIRLNFFFGFLRSIFLFKSWSSRFNVFFSCVWAESRFSSKKVYLQVRYQFTFNNSKWKIAVAHFRVQSHLCRFLSHFYQIFQATGNVQQMCNRDYPTPL